MGFNSHGGYFGDSGISHYQKKESSSLKPGIYSLCTSRELRLPFLLPRPGCGSQDRPSRLYRRRQDDSVYDRPGIQLLFPAHVLYNRESLEGGEDMRGIRTYSFVVAFLAFGFLLLALPEEGFSGFSTDITCCQGDGQCGDSSEGPFLCRIEDVVENAFCNQDTGQIGRA